MDEDKKSKSEKDDADFVIDEKGKPEEQKDDKVEKSPKAIKVGGGSRRKRFINWYKSNKKKSIPLTIVLILVILFAIPFTRYKVAALAVKNNFSIKLVDSTAGTAVSGARVSVEGVGGTTDGSGRVTLKNVPVGSHELIISKKYYRDKSTNVLVPILSQKTLAEFKLAATGRQVKISVKNLINHGAIDGADLKVGEVSAKTDKAGSATIVLPAGTKNAKATLSADGYNGAEVTVTVDDKTIKENNFTLTPAGKIYLLSKLSGKIDIVKTNLDGSDRKTVLPGTGKEDNSGTVLLASRDWKYLALLSRRDGTANPKLYLINTADDSMVTMDSEVATYNPVGWSDHHFVYTMTRQNVQYWQPNAQAIKSYDADSKKVATLDQTRAEGPSQSDYASENYGAVYQVGKNVIYDKYWSAYLGFYGNHQKLADKKIGVYSISVGGSNAQTLKTFDYVDGQSTYVSSVPDDAAQIYYQVSGSDKPTYYAYQDGKLSTKNDIADEFNKYSQQGANTYLQSPTGTNTFWSEDRDGKKSLFIGDTEGENGKQVAALSEFQTYGWFTDEYLLVSKNSSELYVMARTGPSKENQPVKIADYHKPARNFLGYGGGYGGI